MALVGAAVVASILAYGLWKMLTYPGLPVGGHVKLIEGFQWFGAVAYFLPLVAVVAGLCAAAGLLIRGRASDGYVAGLSAPAPRWIDTAKRWTTDGCLPGLLVVAVVGVADQLTGRPLTISTVIGALIGFSVFAAVWFASRRWIALPSRLKPGRTIAVCAAVAALLSAGAVARVQDQSNLALFDQSQTPIQTGFHTVAARSVPGVAFFVPACANPSDCVAFGQGYGYDSNPWRMWALLGTSTDAGVSWTVKAFPDATVGMANCSTDTCTTRLFYRQKTTLVKVTFTTGSPNISQQPLAEAPLLDKSPLCIVTHCLGFETNTARAAGKAFYSDNSGASWSTTALPAPPPLGGPAPPPKLLGPWCTSATDCHGGYIATARCTQSTGAPLCTQFTAIQTPDGGRTWTEQSNPINDPPLTPTTFGISLSINCAGSGTCTAVSALGNVYQSVNWGSTWAGPMHLPPAAQDATCWGATSCMTSGGRYSTLDAGKTWTPQAILGTAISDLVPTWCSDTGSCVGWGRDARGNIIILNRPAGTTTWLAHPIPQPEPTALH